MPSVLARLGPVKASSFQVARRLGNSLRAGFAISHYSALELCPLIWIFEPEHSVDRVFRDLAAQMPVHRTMIVLCECVRDSQHPSPLRTAGFPRAQAARMTEALVTRAVTSYGKAGKKAWNPGAEAELRRSLELNAETLHQSDPRLAAVYAEGIRTALAYFRQQ
jgi:hypothetical protein